MRILLADDHKLVRAGLRALLEGMPGVDVVGEASDGREAVEMALALRPDLVLMDVAMRNLNGLDATARIRAGQAETRVLILSMFANEEYVLQALRAGACGYLLKDAATRELELALAAVARGETYLSPAVSRQVVDGYLQRVSVPGGPAEVLTPRQREILQLIAEGNGTKEIAFRLGLSTKTVETHRSQLMQRLAIRDVAGLVRYAVRTGLVSPDR